MYPGVEGWLWSVEIYEDSVLAKLAQSAHEITEAIGFDKLDIVAWILADVKPFLPSIRMRKESKRLDLPNGRNLEHSWAIVEVLEPEHLTYAQFEEVYRQLRKDFHVTRVKALTPQHERLRSIVERCGGVPTKWGRKAAFWEQVRQEWKQEVGHEEYTGWRPLEKQYQRLMDKFTLAEPRHRIRKPKHAR